MSHEDRRLTEQEFEEILLVIREELEKKLKLLSEDRIRGTDCDLSTRIFNLEFVV